MPKIIILHDIDGRIYFEAVARVMREDPSSSLEYFESVVFKRLAAAIVKRKKLRSSIAVFLRNLKFRISVPFYSGHTIIIGMAPYDIRFFWYALLAINNRVIYHTSWPYWWTNNVPHRYGLLYKLFSHGYKKILQSNKFEFVSVTEPVSNQLRSEFANKIQKFHVIPHAINLDAFYPDTESPLSTRSKILFVGRVVASKGVFDLVDFATRMLPSDYTMTIVGDGADRVTLENNFSSYQNIIFTGRINDKMQIGHLMRSHDILVVPSKRQPDWEELFGLVIIEAMACGMLVLSTDHIGPRGIITDGVDGYLVREEHFVEKLVDIVTQRNAGVTTSLSIRHNAIRAAQQYSLTNISNLWSSVLKLS